MKTLKNIAVELVPGAALALAASFLLCFYGPLELFFTNLEEFRLDFPLLFPPLLTLFCAVFVLGVLGLGLCRLLYVRLYESVLVAGFAGLVSAVLQGLFLSGNLPPLDGRHIQWTEYGAQNLSSLLLWSAAGVAMVLLVRFLHIRTMRRVIGWGSVFLAAVLAVTLSAVGIMNHGFSPKPNAVVTKDGEFQMSEDQNLVIFLLDAVDSRTFSALLEQGDSGFAEDLEDFTYFPNTVCAYPFTSQSIPFILHGQWYENQAPFREFTAQAMASSPLLEDLRRRGYRCGIYEEELIQDLAPRNYWEFENIHPVRPELVSVKALWKQELKLVWYKYAPFPLKRMAHIRMEEFDRNLRLPENTALFLANNADFYGDLQESRITAAPGPCFRFIHIEGAHVPFRYDRAVHVIDESEGTYEQNVQAAMTIFSLWLEKLKDAGLYDNTAIVLMADHGYGHQREVNILGRGNPLLAVKGVSEHHPCAVSQAPISYEDLQTAYGRLLDGASSDQVFDAREGDERSRRILFYAYQHDHHMEEYVQTGHAFDLETLTPTGRVYDAPGGKG